jgi:hypothetical protein
MLNYTEQLWRLMNDIVSRVPKLSFIDPQEIFVFGRFGRRGADGAFATCHSLTLPNSEPGYYFWRDRATGTLTRRSEWFVTKTPEVRIEGQQIKYLISFVLPRFCEQTLLRSRKAEFYPAGSDAWLAKLDTVVHELYHIDPLASGIRQVERADGLPSASSHGRDFLKTVADMVREYLSTQPDPAMYEFLRYTFPELEQRYGGVTATTFRNYPSYPQRYIEVLPPSEQLETPPAIPIQPLRTPGTLKEFSDRDLAVRQFLDGRTRRLSGA